MAVRKRPPCYWSFALPPVAYRLQTGSALNLLANVVTYW
jgi:hypothetical protein